MLYYGVLIYFFIGIAPSGGISAVSRRLRRDALGTFFIGLYFVALFLLLCLMLLSPRPYRRTSRRRSI